MSDGDVLRVAIADPGNLYAIDELRLATRHSLELVVSYRHDIRAELQRLVRTAEAIGSIVAVDLEETSDDSDDLEADDESDGPLVRLVNALIFQAAEETHPMFTSRRRRTHSSCGSASTACCARCSGRRRCPPASRPA